MNEQKAIAMKEPDLSRIPWKGISSLVQDTKNLYVLFRTDYAEYEKSLEIHKLKVKRQGFFVRKLAEIAECAGEDDFAIDLYKKCKSPQCLKYLLWKKEGRRPEDLAGCLNETELDKITGKLVKLKDFQTANVLRRWLRDYHARPSWNHAKAADISCKLGEWQEMFEDIESENRKWEGTCYIETHDLVKYARLCRKDAKEISDKIYDILEQRGLREGRQALAGLARAGKGDKQGAIKAYEKAKRFSQATNLKINLSLPSKKTAIKALEQAFHLNRLNACSGKDSFFNTGGEIERREPYTLEKVLAFKRTINVAYRYHLQEELTRLLLNRGMYTALADINETKVLKLSQDYGPLAKEISTVQNVITQLARKLGDSKSQDLSLVLNEMQGFTKHFENRGYNKDVSDYLTLFFIHELNRNGHVEDNLGNYRIIPLLGQEGLEAITSCFERKQYSLLTECVPQLFPEMDRDEDDATNPIEVLKKVSGEKERQDQAAEMLKTAGARQRRRYSGLGLNLDELDIFYGISNGEVALKRLGFREY